jgi:hypothetical protein
MISYIWMYECSPQLAKTCTMNTYILFESHSTHIRTLTPTSMSISERQSRQILEIDEVTIEARLNLRKCEH